MHQMVASIIAKYQATGMVKNRKRLGRPNTDMPAHTRFVYEAMAQDGKLTARKVKTVGKEDCPIQSSVFLKDNACNSHDYG